MPKNAFSAASGSLRLAWRAALTTLFMGLCAASPCGPWDSPLTSTPLWEAYTDLEIVQFARDTRIMGDRVCAFLCDPRQPSDHKAAVINALGWNMGGSRHAELYRAWLDDKYAENGVSFDNGAITAQEWMCLGYATALSGYDKPQDALPYLEQARRLAPEDYAIAMTLALVKAQVAMDRDWCEVWKAVNAVYEDESLQPNMREQAVEIVMNYIRLYESACRE